MSMSTNESCRKWLRLKLGFHLTVSCLVILLAFLLLIYPAVVIVITANDAQLCCTGQSHMVPQWFKSAAPRFLSWADTYLETDYAGSLRHDDIPATEWPMFAATFFLVTTEDLQAQDKIDVNDDVMREALEKAAEIVASPVTATWVKTKWKDTYLEKENVFYRMLLILGLSSYEQVTGNTQYHALMSQQRADLLRRVNIGAHRNPLSLPSSRWGCRRLSRPSPPWR